MVFELCRLPIEEIEWRCKTFIEGENPKYWP